MKYNIINLSFLVLEKNYFPFFVWERAEPAQVFALGLYRLSFKTLLAVVATGFEVCFLFISLTSFYKFHMLILSQ